MTIAMPIPPPTHIASTPNRPSHCTRALMRLLVMRAGHAERMPERDGAAVDVEPVDVDAERLRRSQRLNGECLVDLEQVDVRQ
jgi:hypothetical protein